MSVNDDKKIIDVDKVYIKKNYYQHNKNRVKKTSNDYYHKNKDIINKKRRERYKLKYVNC